MQKLITITIDLAWLKETSKGPFTVNEIEEVNNFLEAGYIVEEWNAITEDKETEKAVVMVVLNNGLDDEGFDPYEYMSIDEEDDEDDDESAEAGADEHQMKR